MHLVYKLLDTHIHYTLEINTLEITPSISFSGEFRVPYALRPFTSPTNDAFDNESVFVRNDKEEEREKTEAQAFQLFL